MDKKVMEHFRDFVGYLGEFQAPDIIIQETKLKIIHAVIGACIEDTDNHNPKINNTIVDLVLNFDKHYKKVVDDYNKQINNILSGKGTKNNYNSKQKKTDIIKMDSFAEIGKIKMKEILSKQKVLTI